MATTYTFTLRSGVPTSFQANVLVNGVKHDVDDEYAAGPNKIVTTDDDYAAVLKALRVSDGLLFDVNGVPGAPDPAPVAYSPVFVAKPGGGLVDADRNAVTSGSSGSGGLVPGALRSTGFTLADGVLDPVDASGGAVAAAIPSGTAKLTAGVKLVVAGNAVTISAPSGQTFNTAGNSTTAVTITKVNRELRFLRAAGSTVIYVETSIPQSEIDALPLDDSVTEPKLAPAVRTKLNAVASGGGITLEKNLAGLQRNVPATTRLSFPSSPQTGDPSRAQSSATYSQPFPIAAPGGGVRLWFAGFTFINGNSEGDYASAFTVKASVTDTAGVVHPVTFDGGAASKAVASGALVASDPIPDLIIAAGDVGVPMVHTYVSAATNGAWPGIAAGDAGLQLGTWRYTAGADKTALGDTSTQTPNSVYFYGPSLITANTAKATRAVAIFGDSIADGFGDSDNGRGFIARALDTGRVPYVKLTIPGSGAATGAATRRYKLAQGCSDVIDQRGVNNLRGGDQTAAQCMAAIINTGDEIRAQIPLAQRVLKTTITPSSSGTAASQTRGTYQDRIDAVNDWIRDGLPINSARTPVAVGTTTAGTLRAGDAAHCFTGFIEVADQVSTFRNSGIWTQALFGDGTHPSAAGHLAMMRAIDPTGFGAATTDQTLGLDYVAPVVTTLVKKNQWVSPEFPSVDTGTVGVGNAYVGSPNVIAIPFKVDNAPLKIDALAVSVGAAAAGTAPVGRLTIRSRAIDGGFTGNAPLADFGTVDLTQTSALVAAGTSITLPVGQYLLCLGFEGTFTTKPTFRRGVGARTGFPLGNGGANTASGAVGFFAIPPLNCIVGQIQGNGTVTYVSGDGPAPLIAYHIAA